VPKLEIEIESVAIATSHFQSGNDTSRFQVSKDPLDGAIGNTNLEGEFAHRHGRIARQANDDVRVVGEKRPGRTGRSFCGIPGFGAGGIVFASMSPHDVGCIPVQGRLLDTNPLMTKMAMGSSGLAVFTVTCRSGIHSPELTGADMREHPPGDRGVNWEIRDENIVVVRIRHFDPLFLKGNGNGIEESSAGFHRDHTVASAMGHQNRNP